MQEVPCAHSRTLPDILFGKRSHILLADNPGFRKARELGPGGCMVINAHEAEQQQYAAATAIHINTLRILISSLLPLAAKNARNPKLWMEELEQLAIMSADYAKFEAAGAVNPELMKAAVMGALEETLGAAKRSLEVVSA